MAKKALVEKANAQAEVRGPRLHPLQPLRPSARGVPQVRALPHLLPGDGARRRAPRHHQVLLVVQTSVSADAARPTAEVRRRGNRGGKAARQLMTMTDPIADMLTRLRNANSAYHDSVTMPHSKIKTHIAEILQQEGYIAGWSTSRTGRRARSSSSTSSTAPTASGRSPACAACPSRVCASTPRPASCPGSSAGSASRSSRRRPVCSPTAGQQEGRGRGSPRLRLVAEGARSCRASAACRSRSPPASRSPSTARPSP